MSRTPPSFEPLRFPSLAFPLAPTNAMGDSTTKDSDPPRGFSLPSIRPHSTSKTGSTFAFASAISGLSGDSLIRPVVARQTWSIDNASTEMETHSNASVWSTNGVQPKENSIYSRHDSLSSMKRHFAPEMEQEDPESPKRMRSALVKPVKTYRRRQQCRTNQARYRERQKAKLWEKEEDAAGLREHVNLLEVQRSFMRTGGPPRIAFVQHVVVEMFSRFRAGLSGASISDVDLSTDPMSSRSQVSLRWSGRGRAENNMTLLKQIAFVRTVVSADADIGDGLRGPDALLEQLWRYSTLYGNLRLELQTIERVVASDPQAERVMVAGRMKVKITERTLGTVLPGLSSRLRRKLLGKSLTLRLRIDMEFEEAQGSPLLQATRLDMDMDTTTAILAILRSPVDVEEVLRCARISLHGYIGDLTSHPGARKASHA